MDTTSYMMKCIEILYDAGRITEEKKLELEHLVSEEAEKGFKAVTGCLEKCNERSL